MVVFNGDDMLRNCVCVLRGSDLDKRQPNTKHALDAHRNGSTYPPDESDTQRFASNIRLLRRSRTATSAARGEPALSGWLVGWDNRSQDANTAHLRSLERYQVQQEHPGRFVHQLDYVGEITVCVWRGL